jgi:LuxR family transcriptional regulator
MKSWQEDLLDVMEGPLGEEAVFERLARAARALGFEHCTYGLRMPVPLSNPKTWMMSNYPVAWQKIYHDANYMAVDPSVHHCRQSQAPLVWSDEVFKGAPALWEEAKAHGVHFGWAKSSLDGHGIGGMLVLARSNEDITEAELQANELKMRWLANIAHMVMSREVVPRRSAASTSSLTHREQEVLKWTADGKTSNEISDILAVSENTVNFHIKNAVFKMQAVNKTAAAVRAAMLGLLN